MPMKDDEKAELKQLFSDAVLDAMKTFRSQAEEEEAKTQQDKDKKESKSESGNVGATNGKGFSFRGFLLGE